VAALYQRNDRFVRTRSENGNAAFAALAASLHVQFRLSPQSESHSGCSKPDGGRRFTQTRGTNFATPYSTSARLVVSTFTFTDVPARVGGDLKLVHQNGRYSRQPRPETSRSGKAILARAWEYRGSPDHHLKR